MISQSDLLLLSINSLYVLRKVKTIIMSVMKINAINKFALMQKMNSGRVGQQNF